jgi:hypothetical protein
MDKIHISDHLISLMRGAKFPFALGPKNSLGDPDPSSMHESYRERFGDHSKTETTQHNLTQENSWAPGQKETWPLSNSPNNDTQTKPSTTVCHKQGISKTRMN